jgi:hypothetical protein
VKKLAVVASVILLSASLSKVYLMLDSFSKLRDRLGALEKTYPAIYCQKYPPQRQACSLLKSPALADKAHASIIG